MTVCVGAAVRGCGGGCLRTGISGAGFWIWTGAGLGTSSGCAGVWTGGDCSSERPGLAAAVSSGGFASAAPAAGALSPEGIGLGLLSPGAVVLCVVLCVPAA